MGALFKPFAYGLIIAVLSALGLWLVVPLVVAIFVDKPGLWFPALIIIPPLLLGGFVSARQMRTRYLTRYLFMGWLVGIAVMLFVFLVGTISGDIWLFIFIIIAGGAVSMFGSYLGARGSMKV